MSATAMSRQNRFRPERHWMTNIRLCRTSLAWIRKQRFGHWKRQIWNMRSIPSMNIPKSMRLARCANRSIRPMKFWQNIQRFGWYSALAPVSIPSTAQNMSVPPGAALNWTSNSMRTESIWSMWWRPMSPFRKIRSSGLIRRKVCWMMEIP